MGIYKLGKSKPPETATIGGKEYPVVTIGLQKWLGANLDYKFSGCNFNPETWADGNANCCYYGGGAIEYKSRYGLLYNFAAVQLLEANKASLIPGWHVPSEEEFNTLLATIGGMLQCNKLKSKTGWYENNGTNNYNFSALPAGNRDWDDGLYYGDTTITYFLSKDSWNADNANALYLQYNDDIFVNVIYKLSGASIRLIKD